MSAWICSFTIRLVCGTSVSGWQQWLRWSATVRPSVAWAVLDLQVHWLSHTDCSCYLSQLAGANPSLCQRGAFGRPGCATGLDLPATTRILSQSYIKWPLGRTSSFISSASSSSGLSWERSTAAAAGARAVGSGAKDAFQLTEGVGETRACFRRETTRKGSDMSVSVRAFQHLSRSGRTGAGCCRVGVGRPIGSCFG